MFFLFADIVKFLFPLTISVWKLVIYFLHRKFLKSIELQFYPKVFPKNFCVRGFFRGSFDKLRLLLHSEWLCCTKHRWFTSGGPSHPPIVKCSGECVVMGWWNSSGKSQKPLYSKPETIPKLRTSLLIQFCDCCLPALQQRSSQAWVRKEGLFLSGEYCEETLLL